MAGKLCLAMLKQNAYIIRDIYFGIVVNRKKKKKKRTANFLTIGTKMTKTKYLSWEPTEPALRVK